MVRTSLGKRAQVGLPMALASRRADVRYGCPWTNAVATPPPEGVAGHQGDPALPDRVQEVPDPPGVSGKGALLRVELAGAAESGQRRRVDAAPGRSHGLDGAAVGIGPEAPAVEEQGGGSGAHDAVPDPVPVEGGRSTYDM